MSPVNPTMLCESYHALPTGRPVPPLNEVLLPPLHECPASCAMLPASCPLLHVATQHVTKERAARADAVDTAAEREHGLRKEVERSDSEGKSLKQQLAEVRERVCWGMGQRSVDACALERREHTHFLCHNYVFCARALYCTLCTRMWA